MAKRKQIEIKVNVVMTEGAEERITQAFVDLYYDLLARGELPEELLKSREAILGQQQTEYI